MKPKQCYCATCDAKSNPYGWRSRMCVCPVCGDKRCPAAIHHNNQCREKESMTTSDEWKMVPVEPTEEMLAAVADVDSATSNLAKAIYMTMVAAAPACIVEVSIDPVIDTSQRNTGVILDEHRSDVLNALRAMREEKSASEGGSPNSDAALNLLFSAASESVRHIMGDEPSPGETVDIIAGIFRKAMDESNSGQ